MIRKQDYQFLSNNLGAAQFVGHLMYDSLGDMIRHLNANEVPMIDVDKRKMLGAIQDVYQIVLVNHVYVGSEMSTTVRALQDYVIKHFGSVDAYLSGHNIRVSRSFANLSNVIGYPISEENIE